MDELKEFVEKYQIPVTNTLLGLGSIQGDHELFLGMAGMHGTVTANMAITECDVLINIGARFDDRLTGNLEAFAPNAKVIHIDIDPAEIGKNVPTEIPIVADAKEALKALLNQQFESPETEDWLTYLKENAKEFPLWYNEDDNEILPQQAVEIIHRITDGDAIVTTDVGQHQMWAAQYYSLEQSGSLGNIRWTWNDGLRFPSSNWCTNC